MVAGTSLNARLDVRCWSVIVSNFTAQWVEVPDGAEFVPPNTRQVIPLPGVLVAKAAFAAPPGIAQPGAGANQACFFTFTEQVLPPSGGLVGATALAAQVNLERFARANIPASAAGNAGRLIELTNYDRNLWIDDGTLFASMGMEVISVRAWDAVGDGVTDDRTAIQNAINALPAGGGVVYFPPTSSAYLVSSPGLTIGKGVRLIGAGKHIALIQATANAGYALVTTNSGLGGGQEIAHLQFLPNGALNNSIIVKGVDHAYIHDCRFFGAVDAHIILDNNNIAGAYTHRIDNNEIDNTTTANSVGIRITNTAGAPNSGSNAGSYSNNRIIADAPVVYVNFAGGTQGGETWTGNLLQPRVALAGIGYDLSANCSGIHIIGGYIDNFATGIRNRAGSGIGANARNAAIGVHDAGATNFVVNDNAGLDGILVVGAPGLHQAGQGIRTAGDVVINAGAFTDVTDVTVTLTLPTGSRGRVLVTVSGSFNAANATRVDFQLVADGVNVFNTLYNPTVAGTDYPFSFSWLATGLAAGARIFKLQATRGVGALTIYGGSTALRTTQITAEELN